MSRLPRTRAHWISCVALWVVFLVWAGAWVHAHRGWLFDPMLQNDDARFGLFAFHRYADGPTLRDDPIAAEAIVRAPPGLWFLYRTLTPLVGLYWASKVVQVICLALIGVAAAVLARCRRGGLAAGLLLAFVLLHTPFVVNKIGGGHGRAFAFPLAALWVAGVVARTAGLRFAAVAGAALFYAPAALLLLTAEGFLTLFELRGADLRAAAARFAAPARRFAVLVAVFAACVLPQKLWHDSHGRVHTLAEARQEPAFVYSPRRVLPFPPPLQESARYLEHPFRAHGRGPLAEAWDALGPAGPWLVVAGLAVVVLRRRARVPAATLALLLAAAATYLAARGFAFRLYSPVRYIWYGVTAASVALAVTTLGTLWPLLRPRAARAVRRNAAAAAAIALAWAVTGDGFIRPGEPARDGTVRHNGMSIDGRDEAALYAFVRTLPPEARIALHPGDGAGITYWTGRATTEHHETLQPWWYEPWRRSVARTRDTLRALYATDPAELLEYCDRAEVTHVLLHMGRYNEHFRANALFWPPFESFVRRLVAGVERRDLAVLRVPEAVVYDRGPWVLLDVGRVETPLIAGSPATSAAGSSPDAGGARRPGAGNPG